MKALIKYIDFHMDNYQGGSGKTVEGTLTLDIPQTLVMYNFFDFMHKELEHHLYQRRPFGKSEQGYKYTVTSVELV